MARFLPFGALVVAGVVVRGRKNPLHQGLALRLRRARKAAALNRHELASRAGVSDPLIRHIEEGSVPGIDTIERIALALGMSPCWLAYGMEGRTVFQQKTAGRAAPPGALPPQGGVPGQAAGPKPVPVQHRGIPDRLRQARNILGLTRRALGRDSRTSDTTVRQVEERQIVPTVATVERLALALKVSPCWLAYGEGEGPGGD
jgi:transcriptional regulator with XRE-family HTH domain